MYKKKQIRKYKKNYKIYRSLPSNICVNWHAYEYDVGTGLAGTDGDSFNLLLSSFTGSTAAAAIFKSYKIIAYGLDVFPRCYNGT